MQVLLKQGVLDPEGDYRLGQSVGVIVIGRSETTRRDQKRDHDEDGGDRDMFVSLLLALDIVGNSKEDISRLAEEAAKLNYNTGSDTGGAGDTAANKNLIVAGTVVKLDEDGENVMVRLDDGRSAKMLKTHFFDFAATTESIPAAENPAYQAGFRVEEAVILQAIPGQRYVIISAKPLLVSTARKISGQSGVSGEVDSAASLPQEIGDLSPGQVVVGFIHKVESYGVIVRFRGTLSALAPRPNIADRFINSPVGLFSVGDSIRCVVQRVDISTHRAFVTFKPSIVSPSCGENNYITSWLREQFRSATATSVHSLKILPDWSKYPLGTVARASISSVESYGTVLIADDNTTIMLAKGSHRAKASIGATVDVVVLDFDFKGFVLEVSLDVSLLPNAMMDKPTKKSGKKLKGTTATTSQPSLSIGEKVDGHIVLVKEKYLLVVTTCKTLGIVMLADYHVPKPEHVEYVIGNKMALNVLFPGNRGVDLTYPHKHLAVFAKYQEDGISKSIQKLGWDRSLDNIYRPGHAAPWIVTEVAAIELTLKPSEHSDVFAKLHISQVGDPAYGLDNLNKILLKAKKASGKSSHSLHSLHPLHPFRNISVGDVVTCVTQQYKVNSSEGSAVGKTIFYLSSNDTKLSVSVTAATSQPGDATERPFSPMIQAHGKHSIKESCLYPAVVTTILKGGFYVSFTPYLSTFVSLLNISRKFDLLEALSEFAFVGMKLIVLVKEIARDPNTSKLKITASRADVEHLLVPDSPFADLTKSRLVNKVV